MTSTRISRRRFLQVAGSTAGAALLARSGLASAGAGDNHPIVKSPIQRSDGAAKLSDGKILVAYATEAGSTRGVAEELGKQLAASGASVDVRPVKEVSDLKDYRAALVGSAIHGGEWLPEAVQFVKDHQTELSQMRTAFFLVCMMVVKDTQQNRDFVAGYLEPVRAMVKPVAEGRFAGALLLEKYSFFQGLGLRIFLAYLRLRSGDYRDWPAIRAWADSTLPLLAA